MKPLLRKHGCSQLTDGETGVSGCHVTRQQGVGLSPGLSFSLVTDLREFLNGEKNLIQVKLKSDASV